MRKTKISLNNHFLKIGYSCISVSESVLLPHVNLIGRCIQEIDNVNMVADLVVKLQFDFIQVQRCSHKKNLVFFSSGVGYLPKVY